MAEEDSKITKKVRRASSAKKKTPAKATTKRVATAKSKAAKKVAPKKAKVTKKTMAEKSKTAKKTPKKAAKDSVVILKPPVIVAGVFILGILLDFIFPLHFMIDNSKRIFGVIFVLGGAGAILWAIRSLTKSGNKLDFNSQLESLVTSGIYSYSRNPIYLSFILIGLGFSFALDNLWLLFLQALVFFIFNNYIIPKEEKYLAKSSPTEYQEYSKAVRRWF